MLTPHRRALIDAAGITLDLAGSPAVAAAWDDESSCVGMTVGGLAHHLIVQTVNIARLLDADPGSDPIPLLEHYRRAAWVGADLDAEVNVGIATSSNESAVAGQAAAVGEGREALARLPELLAAPRDPDVVLIPWQGWSLSTDDFLTTRLMEMVVHSDDLASSVGLATPEFPEDATTPVFALLAGVAARRHGQAAVVRALSRPQRAPESVSAF